MRDRKPGGPQVVFESEAKITGPVSADYDGQEEKDSAGVTAESATTLSHAPIEDGMVETSRDAAASATTLSHAPIEDGMVETSRDAAASATTLSHAPIEDGMMIILNTGAANQFEYLLNFANHLIDPDNATTRDKLISLLNQLVSAGDEFVLRSKTEIFSPTGAIVSSQLELSCEIARSPELAGDSCSASRDETDVSDRMVTGCFPE
ncbi:hypothetical protein J6590_077100 [Homalodisca vitripennis]|nr:hypothetical protein J6590_077100 [Homalodisca vitripennis]